jgi:hypothetical protein
MATEFNKNDLIVNSISISGTEFNSSQWNSAYTTLYSQSANWQGAISNIAPIVSTFTLDVYTNGEAIWQKPEGAKRIKVTAVGGGGGGASGERDATSNTSRGGGGGGGGGHSSEIFEATTIPNSVLVNIGAGGTGGESKIINSGGAEGTDGGISQFGNFLLASGGKRGFPNPDNLNTGIIYGGLGGIGDISGTVGGSYRSNILIADAAIHAYKSGAGGGAGGTKNGTSLNAPGIAGVNLRLFSETDTSSSGASGKSVTTSYNINDLTSYGGCGGGGGSAGVGVDGVDGGAGGLFGGGGGGGGGSNTASGAGGPGGPGIVVVTTYF